MLYCPECGTMNSDNARFCKNCGEDFQKSNKEIINNVGRCPYCAEEINPAAVKCKHCGEWLDTKVKPLKASEDYSAVIVIGIIFTILGGVIGLIISFYLVTRKDERAHNAGAVLLVVNIIWIFILLMLYVSWMNSLNSYYYYY